MQSWPILSSHTVVLASLGPLLGCSWHACRPQNSLEYGIVVGVFCPCRRSDYAVVIVTAVIIVVCGDVLVVVFDVDVVQILS